MQLPIFPAGVTHVTRELAVSKQDGVVTYFNGHMPIFRHDESDIRSFRMITSQFCVTGTVQQAQIARVFGIPVLAVKRAVKRYREQGPEGFYRERVRRGPAVLVPEVLREVQGLLDQGLGVPDAASRVGLKPDTLRKAVQAGRVHRRAPAGKSSEVADLCLEASTKSQRSRTDNEAEMGVGATNTGDRVAASAGLLAGEGVALRFVPAWDVPNGGVLLALPALVVTGLLRHTAKYFRLPKGYYGLPSIFVLLAFLALARLKSIEALRYCAPGEWGKLVGLDRVPEVRTLREKVACLSREGQPLAWSAELCREWMEGAPEQAQVLYVDGHVRVYHGDQTELPRHYVSRQKLCLRATADYWVNAMDGQPFFVVHQDVDPGLVQVLENEIVPRLEREVPGQPTPEELAADPWRHRFLVIFDREGYSPELMGKMKQRRIACMTYRRKPGDDWRPEEFRPREVKLACGQVTTMKLAERGVFLGGKVWVREIRRLTDSGHQTAIVSTDYRSDLAPAAAAMFARWSQENFFRYMREHYNLDRLIEYGTEEIPDTTRVVNPEYRRLDGELRKKASQLSRVAARFGALSLEGEIDPRKMEKYQQEKAELQTEMNHLREQVDALKARRKGVKRHVSLGQLPEQDRFERLRIYSKHLIDTIKMIAYRAETAMAHVLREKMSHHDEARTLLRALYSTEADLVPDEAAGTLTIRLHHLANRAADEAVRHLCADLNSTETVFPGTNLRLVYEMVSSKNPRPQEV